MRVWLNRNGKNTFEQVESISEAKAIIRKAIAKDLKDDNVITNAFGFEVIEDGDWSEYYDNDGNDIMEAIDNEDKKAEAIKKLSANQKLFVKDAERAGLEVDYSYSGRGMYGKTCPSVNVDRLGEFGTRAKTQSDSMGLGYVIYARY